MIKSGRDYKFKPIPQADFNQNASDSTLPPVQVAFTTSLDGNIIKYYSWESFVADENTDMLQTSNTNRFSTSSIPFIEDETNRHTAPSNNTYSDADDWIVV